MGPLSKRTREVDETSRAEYQFQVRVTNAEKSPRKKKKRRTIKDGADSGPDEILDQVCPFIPSGTINSSKTMDVQYVVEPSERWSKMASYNSFVCMQLPVLLVFGNLRHAHSACVSERVQILYRQLHLRCK